MTCWSPVKQFGERLHSDGGDFPAVLVHVRVWHTERRVCDMTPTESFAENLERLRSQNPLGSIDINKPLATEAIKALAGEIAALWDAVFVIAAQIESLR